MKEAHIDLPSNPAKCAVAIAITFILWGSVFHAGGVGIGGVGVCFRIGESF